jgi:hypothetical protein
MSNHEDSDFSIKVQQQQGQARIRSAAGSLSGTIERLDYKKWNISTTDIGRDPINGSTYVLAAGLLDPNNQFSTFYIEFRLNGASPAPGVYVIGGAGGLWCQLGVEWDELFYGAHEGLLDLQESTPERLRGELRFSTEHFDRRYQVHVTFDIS